MAEREAKHAAKGARAQIHLETTHDVIRAQTSPVPVKIELETRVRALQRL
ncbi:hypothetical protein [Mesorhizobium sp. CA4]|nr:hypothetical protein [Mesorhizobium sp. CA4]MBZ9818020.1 hypothetical protein [Mesorhizobium sp. CA4]